MQIPWHAAHYLVLITLVVASKGGDCEAADMLAAAKERYKMEMGQAASAVVEEYRSQIGALNASGDVVQARQLLEQMNFFEQKRGLFGNETMQEAFAEYGRAKKKAAEKLREAYATAISDRVNRGDGAAAERLQLELTELALPETLVSFVQSGRPIYLQHAGYVGICAPVRDPESRLNSTWEMVNGLAGANLISIRSANIPDHYLAHGNHRIRLQPLQDSREFRQNSTFKVVPGLANRKRGISLESVNYPGHFVRARSNGEVWLDRLESSRDFREEATFIKRSPNFNLW